MKNKIKILMLIFLTATMFGCSYEETDFGFNSSINGLVKDPSGSLLYGDINSNALVVKLLGEGDKQAIEVRVDGNGEFQNTKMYPKIHKVWLEGPIVNSDTLTVDLASNTNQIADFKVTPLISPSIANGNVAGTTVTVNYTILPNTGIIVKKIEIYCSTVKFPTASTGSLANVYFTKTTAVTALTGSTTISGLTAGTKYYIRIGAQAGISSVMNYSNQIEANIP